MSEALARWVNRRGHRANLLSQLYVTVRVGIANADNEAIFATANSPFLDSEKLAAK